MKKDKTGKSQGSDGRHIGAGGPTLGRGHSRGVEEHQEAGSGHQHVAGKQNGSEIHDPRRAPHGEKARRQRD